MRQHLEFQVAGGHRRKAMLVEMPRDFGQRIVCDLRRLFFRALRYAFFERGFFFRHFAATRFQRLGFFFIALLFRVRCQHAFAVDYAFKGGAHAVVIFGRNRIELMIVAARAIDRDAKKRIAGRGNEIIQRVRANDFLLHFVLIADAVVGAAN